MIVPTVIFYISPFSPGSYGFIFNTVLRSFFQPEGPERIVSNKRRQKTSQGWREDAIVVDSKAVDKQI